MSGAPAVEIVIAARGGPAAKSRARPLLGSACAELVEAMLGDMLDGLRSAASVARITLVTPNDELAELAEAAGAGCIRDSGAGHSAAVALARRRIAARAPGAALLFLPGDLPLLDPAEVARVAARHRPGTAVLVPSTSDGGTAALLFEARHDFPFAYGTGSFRRHSQAAAQLGLAARVAAAPSLTRDMDRPEDFAALTGAGRGARTRALLRRLPPGREAA